jgi:hypothetical protein
MAADALPIVEAVQDRRARQARLATSKRLVYRPRARMETNDPYAPPTAELGVRSTPNMVGRLTQGLLALGGAAYLPSMYSSWLGYRYHMAGGLGDDGIADPTLADWALVVDGVGAVVLIVTMIVFARFIVLTKREARRLGALGLAFTPAWSVGWYFVPIANLWKPYQAMAETFRASSDWSGDRRSWRRVRVPAIVPLWWGAWIASSIADQVSMQLLESARSDDAYARAYLVDIAASVVSIALAVIAFALVKTLGDMQDQRRAMLDDGRITVDSARGRL